MMNGPNERNLKKEIEIAKDSPNSGLLAGMKVRSEPQAVVDA